MQTNADQLIEEMISIMERSTCAVRKFKELSTGQLNYKKDPEQWSILECIEHLNLYGDFYLPEIEKQIQAHKTANPPATFKSGIIGNYFANLMMVKEEKIKKMKSPADKNPSGCQLSVTTIERFLKQQELLKLLLLQARYVDLTRTKAAISLTRLIKLRLEIRFGFLFTILKGMFFRRKSWVLRIITGNRLHPFCDQISVGININDSQFPFLPIGKIDYYIAIVCSFC